MTVAKNKNRSCAHRKLKSEGELKAHCSGGTRKGLAEDSGWRSMRRRSAVHSNGGESLSETQDHHPQSVPKQAKETTKQKQKETNTNFNKKNK
jgi:hypothetical protein